MPPKKAAAAKADKTDSDGDKTFRWSPENERRLLLLCLGRTSFGKADYAEFVKVMPPGASYEGIRQKVPKLRNEARAIYAEYGLPMPDGTPATATAATGDKSKGNGRKRAAPATAPAADGSDEEVAEKVVKKAKGGRGKKVKSEDIVDEEGKEEEADGPEIDLGGVKQEEGCI